MGLAQSFSKGIPPNIYSKNNNKIASPRRKVSALYTPARAPTKGDTNGDGICDVSDVVLAINFVSHYVNENTAIADINLNGVIDLVYRYRMSIH
ncbi:MAG: hypothetical protein QXV28_09320 [Ignisphaera sp.]